MGPRTRRRAEWGIGLASIAATVLLFLFATTALRGVGSLLLLVVAGGFLLVGLFFLTGIEPGRPARRATGPSRVRGAAEEPAGGKGSASVVAASLVECGNCHERVAKGAEKCPECGHAL